MAEHLDIGRKGEVLATEYLKQGGYKILGRNITNPYGTRLGEIDIVAEKNKMIVFVEVKTLFLRREKFEYLPEHQVTRSKLVKLQRIASYYLRSNHLETREYRFDVVSVILRVQKEPCIEHLESVFL